MDMDGKHQRVAIAAQHTSGLAAHEFLSLYHRPPRIRLHRNSHGYRLTLDLAVEDIARLDHLSMLERDRQEKDTRKCQGAATSSTEKFKQKKKEKEGTYDLLMEGRICTLLLIKNSNQRVNHNAQVLPTSRRRESSVRAVLVS